MLTIMRMSTRSHSMNVEKGNFEEDIEAATRSVMVNCNIHITTASLWKTSAGQWVFLMHKKGNVSFPRNDI